jgi:hypothetical protein
MMYHCCPVCDGYTCTSGTGDLPSYGPRCRCGGIESLKKAARRYEIARRINPQQWAELWALNISTNKPFDEIIDDFAPFVGVK